MCGIAGVFKLSGAITVGDVSAVLEMLDAQFHRGPDDWGLLLPRPALDEPEIKTLLDRVDPTHVSTYPATSSAPGVVLGSRRLAIIDRSFRGRMPMGTEHDERWVVLNGRSITIASFGPSSRASRPSARTVTAKSSSRAGAAGATASRNACAACSPSPFSKHCRDPGSCSAAIG